MAVRPELLVGPSPLEGFYRSTTLSLGTEGKTKRKKINMIKSILFCAMCNIWGL